VNAGRVPGMIPGVHYNPDPTHFRKTYSTQDLEELIPIVCSLDEDIVEGIPITFTNGSCHNLEDPFVGASLQLHDRLLDPAYIDGRGLIDGRNRPSAREISNLVVKQPDGLDLNIKDSSRLLIFFGQFMDHDFALVLEQLELELDEDDPDAFPVADLPELLEVEVPEDDDQFDEAMEFGRSEFCLDEDFVRQFQAELTPWLDLGTVYGDTQERTDFLRAFDGEGLLRADIIQGEEFPPLNETTGLRDCGDIRCEENTMLFAWHTLFLRNHNYYAREFAEGNAALEGLDPLEADNIIFENARIRNIVEYQQIVWDQYLPYLLGRRTFAQLTGDFDLDLDEDPVCTLIFTTAVFRYGHSGVSNQFSFLDEDLDQTRADLALAESFFNSEPLIDDPDLMGEMFIGQAAVAHDILDSRCVDGIRDNLFANVEMFEPGFDLPARNIERGRDHGIATFNYYRQEFGLDMYECPNDPIDCFYQLTSDTEIAEALYELYGDIEECETWVCGMAEDAFEDSLLGETFTVIMADQFNRMRNADRIWYENVQAELENALYAPVNFPTTLVDVVERNTDVDVPQDNMFMVSPVWQAFASEEEVQVEWYLPPRLRGEVDNFEISVSGGASFTVEQEPNELLFYVFEANPGRTYTVEVSAILVEGEPEILGTVDISTPGSPLGAGGIVGIAVGATAFVAGVVGGICYCRSRRGFGSSDTNAFLEI
jgi:hypothetical protein